MVVSESALRKMMEKAYKGGGYHVATGNTPFGYCLMIANYMLNPDFEELAVLKDAQPFIVEDCLCARGQHSQIFIGRIRPGDHEKDRVSHLGLIQWT